MTEHEFDRAVENAAERFETCVEAAADRLDRGISRRWQQRPFRIFIKTLSVSAGLGLIGGGLWLSAAGHKALARWCVGLGAAGLLAELCKALIFRHDGR